MIEPSSPAFGRLVWSVAALVQAVADALQARFVACAVRGEISSFSRAGSGHCYFCLKDADGREALIRCAMFRRTAAMVDFTPSDGMLVELRGRLAVYEPRGELQFIVEAMTRAGDGALMEQFVRLKARLEAEGLFDLRRKRELPAFPRRLGVITSLGAAALHDVCVALARRAPHVKVIVYPSLVQGPEAPAALVRALVLACKRNEVDMLLLCRGGGSLEDLWAFNDERVVRAVAASPIPIVCGVGHETDVTLADFAADLRAPTPTAAAEIAAPPRAELLGALSSMALRARRVVRQRLDQQGQRLDHQALRLARPAEVLRRHHQRLALVEQRVRTALARRLELQQQILRHTADRLLRRPQANLQSRSAVLEALAARLALLDPRQVMARGYAWVSDEQGRPVVSALHVTPGQVLRNSWQDGEAEATVTRVEAR